MLFAFLLPGCCKKMLPGIDKETIDSVYTETIINYTTDTLRLPGDTVKVGVLVPCPQFKIDTSIKKGRTTLHLKAENGKLEAACETDSLVHVIDSLKQIVKSTTKSHIKIMTIRQPVEVIKYKTPFWVWLLIAVVGLYIYGRISGKIRF